MWPCFINMLAWRFFFILCSAIKSVNHPLNKLVCDFFAGWLWRLHHCQYAMALICEVDEQWFFVGNKKNRHWL
jgi:hypothetical protein